MEGKIINIEYNGEESILIKVSPKFDEVDVEKSLKKFKETETFKSDEWSDDELVDHLISDGIELEHIPNYPNGTIHLPTL